MSTKYEDIKITANALGEGEVWLNGAPLKGLVSFSVTSSVGGPTEVTVTLVANVNCHPKP